MKKLVTLLLFCIPLVGINLFAQSASIGIIDLGIVLQESNAGKMAMQELKDNEMASREKMDAMLKAYRDKELAIQKSSTSKSVDDQQKAVFELQKMEAEILRDSEMMESEINQLRSTKLAEIENAIHPLVEAIAKEKDLLIVLRHSTDSNIFYYSEKIDITGEVVKKLDASKQ